MGQLAAHYLKVQQKRQADVLFFKADMKVKFAEKIEQKALEVEDYRLRYRVAAKHLEKRRAEVAAEEAATAKIREAAMDIVAKKLFEISQQMGQATATVDNREAIKRTLAEATAE